MWDKAKCDLNKLKRYSLKKRFSKVETKMMGGDVKNLFGSMPDTLAAKDLNELADAIINAKKKKNKIIFSFGGHVVKVGLSPIILKMLEEGFINHVVFNGATMIHDFELAFNSATSENVDEAIKDGSFGMALETGSIINNALQKPEMGLGYNIGKHIFDSSYKNKKLSIASKCFEKKIPLTVHVAIGTDIIHFHKEFNPEKTGRATFEDFRKIIDSVCELENGVFLNFGSAVLIPEVFLKAITVARNLGYKLKNITTANFDFLHQYREVTNIVKRPTNLGGKGYNFIGHHEIMLPLLYALLKERL